MLKASFIRRIDLRTPEHPSCFQRGGDAAEELQTDGGRGEEEVVKNSSLITSPPFIHISLEDSSLSLARDEGKGRKKGGETPRGVAIATPIIRMPTASGEVPSTQRERERKGGRGKPVGCENGERLLYETGSSLSLKKNPTADRIVGE